VILHYFGTILSPVKLQGNVFAQVRWSR